MPKAIPKISLAAARINACLNQREAAKAIGISRVTLQSYEKGSTVPDWDKVQRIEEVYAYPASYIFFGKKTRLKREINAKSNPSEPARHSGT